MKLKEINILNVLLCLCVIMIHLTGRPIATLGIDSIWHPIKFSANKFLTFAVPGFIFLSGYKLYNKYKSNKLDVLKFYAQRFKKVLVPYFVSYSVYFLYYFLYKFSAWNTFLEGLFLGTLVSHFYYIIVATQLYIIFPLINPIFKKFGTILLILSFGCTIIFNQFVSFQYIDRFFGTYIFYFILGMFVSKHFTEKKIKLQALWPLLFIIVAIVHIYLCYIMSLDEFWYKQNGIGQVIYNTLAVLTLYNLCIDVKENTAVQKVVSLINPHTFYIFLYHTLIIDFLKLTVYPCFALTDKKMFILNFVVVWAVTLLYCVIANKIKKRNL